MVLIIRLKTLRQAKLKSLLRTTGFVSIIHGDEVTVTLSICMMAQMKGLNIINIHYFQFNIIQKRRQALVTLTICLMSLFK